MALKKVDSSNPPPASIRLSKQEAIDFQTNRVESWKNPSELWFLKYGGRFLGGVTMVSSGIILNFIRWKLRLNQTLRISSYTAITIIPALGTVVAHNQFIRNRVLIQEICPVCVEIRSLLYQYGFGILQPTLLSMILSFSAAHNSYSYPIPDFKPTNPSKFYRFTGKLLRQARSRLVGVFLLQTLATSLVTYKQYDELEILNKDDYKEELEEFS